MTGKVSGKLELRGEAQCLLTADWLGELEWVLVIAPTQCEYHSVKIPSVSQVSRNGERGKKWEKEKEGWGGGRDGLCEEQYIACYT